MILAFSLQSIIKSIGAYAGFVALVGVALLAMLYFAQARELRRLSDWIEQEGERRLSTPAPAPRPVAPAPGGVLVRPVPAPSAQPLATAAPAAPGVSTAVPGVRRVVLPGTGAIGAATPAGALGATPEAPDAGAPQGPEEQEDGVIAAPAPPLAPAGGAIAAANGQGRPAPELGARGPQETAVHDVTAALQSDSEADGEEALAPGSEQAREPVPFAAVPLAAAPAPTAEPAAAPGPGEGRDTPLEAPGADPGPAPLLAPSTAAGARSRFPPPPPAAPSAPPEDSLTATPAAPPARPEGPFAATPAAPPAASPARPDGPFAATPVAPPAAPPSPPERSVTATPAALPPPAPAAGARVPAIFDVAHETADSGEPTRRRVRLEPTADAEDEGPRHPAGSTLRLLGAAVVIVLVLIFVADRIFGGSSGTPPAKTTHTSTSQTAGPPAPARSTITVAVLNGTLTAHLASNGWARLASRGYRQGTIANAPVQTHLTTVVAYTRGQRAAALEVARDLGVATLHVHPVSAATLSAADTGGRSAQVVATLGSDFSQLR